jgi:HlyD family secretion protein
VIEAPVDGVVVSRTVDVGQTVAASLQAPTLFTIAQDLTKMQVDTNVAEADVGRVQVGHAASFTVDAFPGRTFRGEVVQIRKAAQVLQNVVTYDVVVSAANPDLILLPTMTTSDRDRPEGGCSGAERGAPLRPAGIEAGARSPEAVAPGTAEARAPRGAEASVTADVPRSTQRKPTPSDPARHQRRKQY